MILERIKMLRQDHDIKQQEIAELLHIKQTTYSKYELGKVNIPLDAIMIIADYYETSVDYLLERTDVTEPYPKSRRKK